MGNQPDEPREPGTTTPERKSRRDEIAWLVAGFLLVWLVAAYVIIPFGWRRYARHHPTFDDDPRITQTRDHHPGDPLNVAFIGTEAQLQSAMKAAQWYPAAALGLRSDLKIAADTVVSRPDVQAPVSSLYLFGRRQDLAFEQPVGHSPRHRHHVRLWKTERTSRDGRQIWIGSAVYDRRVGLSHATGQITHRIAPDIDAERDYLFECLEKTGNLTEHYSVDGFHQHLEGRNGGGDLWHTDGTLYVGVFAESVP